MQRSTRQAINAFCFLALLTFNALAEGTGGINAPSKIDKPYLVLVSLDGLTSDELEAGFAGLE